MRSSHFTSPGLASPGGPEPDSSPAIRVDPAGCGGLLFNPAGSSFSIEIQQKLWAMRDELAQAHAIPGVREAVLGVNNLLVLFDPLRAGLDDMEQALRALWPAVQPKLPNGQEFVIPVVYGGEGGEDLAAVCANLGMAPEQFVALHSNAQYTVACIGSTPGFAFLAGLPPELATPRRQAPRLKVPKGSVMIGGPQAGVQPMTAPSGWHVLGTTTVEFFDPLAVRPCLLQPGDRVRFEMKALLK